MLYVSRLLVYGCRHSICYLAISKIMLHCNLGHKIRNYDGILKTVQNQHEKLDSCIRGLEGGQECLEMVAHILNKKVIMVSSLGASWGGR